jgi:hypothetical protein
MQIDDPIIEAIKTKILNTISPEETNLTFLGDNNQENIERGKFRRQYFSPEELLTEIKLIDDKNKRNNLISWITKRKSKDPMIKQVVLQL